MPHWWEDVVRGICSTLNITSLDQLDKILNAQLSKTICEKIDKAITQISRTTIDRSQTVIDRLGKTICDKVHSATDLITQDFQGTWTTLETIESKVCQIDMNLNVLTGIELG